MNKNEQYMYEIMRQFNMGDKFLSLTNEIEDVYLNMDSTEIENENRIKEDSIEFEISGNDEELSYMMDQQENDGNDEERYE